VSVRRHLLRSSAYLDSVVLLALQRQLAAAPGVRQAAAVMATPANREVLADAGLLPADLPARTDDLLVLVEADDESAANAALSRVDEMMAARRPSGATRHHPRSLETALRALPAARWVLVSVPGRHAVEVSRRALAAGRNVFLFSDNVRLADEVALKREARQRGLLLLGPDCGTAVVAGVGLGFANRVRRGAVGVVAASGTGLQAFLCHLDALGGGISHALGTGGRDLGAEVGGAAALQALELLARDEGTAAIVLISKPPAPEVAGRWLAAAAAAGKPVVAWLLGTPLPGRRIGSTWFAASPEDAAELATRLVNGELVPQANDPERTGPLPVLAAERPAPPPTPRYLRGLFGGGTLALQAVAGLQLVCAGLRTNVPLSAAQRMGDPRRSEGHCVVDLGADELTAGRPHPMLDPSLLAERLLAEAADPQVLALLFDVVLGDGAHPDPAAVLAPALAAAQARALEEGRDLSLIAVLQGSAADPQNTAEQAARLGAAGAIVSRSVEEGVGEAWRLLAASSDDGEAAPPPLGEALATPLAAVNVGLALFHDALLAQGASVVHVDWRPPAGGDEELSALLQRMR
jgi:FdrA protein